MSGLTKIHFLEISYSLLDFQVNSASGLLHEGAACELELLSGLGARRELVVQE